MSKAIEIEVRVSIDMTEGTRSFISSLTGARGLAPRVEEPEARIPAETRIPAQSLENRTAGAETQIPAETRIPAQSLENRTAGTEAQIPAQSLENRTAGAEAPRGITPEDMRYACNAVYKSLLGEGWETHPQKKAMTRVFKDIAAHFGSMTRKPSDVPADRRGEYLNELGKIMINQSTGAPEWIPFDTALDSDEPF